MTLYVKIIVAITLKGMNNDGKMNKGTHTLTHKRNNTRYQQRHIQYKRYVHSK